MDSFSLKSLSQKLISGKQSECPTVWIQIRPDILLGQTVCKDYQQTTLVDKELSIHILIDFSLTVKAATLISISGHGLAISSAKQGKSGSIYNLVKNK